MCTAYAEHLMTIKRRTFFLILSVYDEQSASIFHVQESTQRAENQPSGLQVTVKKGQPQQYSWNKHDRVKSHTDGKLGYSICLWARMPCVNGLDA